MTSSRIPAGMAARMVGPLAALAALAVGARPAAAVTFHNACTNSLIPTKANLVDVTMSATAPASTSPGAAVGLTGITQQLAIPSAVFVAAYNAGLLTTGPNLVPVTSIHTAIVATNTAEGTQTTNNASGTAS